MLFIQSVLIALVYVLGILDGRILGQNLINTPIVEALLVGIILGDIHTSLVMGATLQLIFMGFVGIGVTSLPSSSAGTILAVTFAIMQNLDPDTAIALSMPVALLFQPVNIIPRIINNIYNGRCDAAAAKGDDKAIDRYFWMGEGSFIVCFFVPMFLAVYYGQGPVQAIINAIPAPILAGLTKASSILPALGIALLLNYIFDKRSAPYVFLGFVLSAFLGMDSLGIAAIGAIIAVVYYFSKQDAKEGN